MEHLTPEEMDAVLDAHYKYEAADDVDGVLSTLTDDVVHDVVGLPGGPNHGKEAVRAFYEHLFDAWDVHRDVLRCLVSGLTNGEIAGQLGVSQSTIKFHVSSILSKLGAAGRTEAVAVALHHRLVL